MGEMSNLFLVLFLVETNGKKTQPKCFVSLFSGFFLLRNVVIHAFKGKKKDFGLHNIKS